MRNFPCCLLLLEAAGGRAGPQGCSQWLWAGPASWLQGEAPGGETGFAEGIHTRTQEKTFARIHLLLGVAGCELGKSLPLSRETWAQGCETTEPTPSAFLHPSQVLESGLMVTGPGAGNTVLNHMPSPIPTSLPISGEKLVSRSLQHTARSTHARQNHRVFCGLGQVTQTSFLLSIPICKMGVSITPKL